MLKANCKPRPVSSGRNFVASSPGHSKILDIPLDVTPEKAGSRARAACAHTSTCGTFAAQTMMLEARCSACPPSASVLETEVEPEVSLLDLHGLIVLNRGKGLAAKTAVSEAWAARSADSAATLCSFQSFEACSSILFLCARCKSFCRTSRWRGRCFKATVNLFQVEPRLFHNSCDT